MECKKIKAGCVIWCALLGLICPMGMATAENLSSPLEAQNVTYGENADDVIPIVLSADNNYGPQMYITVSSILKNSNADTHHDFHLLVPSNFEKRYKVSILELGIRHGSKINFVDMGTAFANSPLKNEWPAPVYYRLLIPSLLPNYKKCLYLDTDIIVSRDLMELFNTDLEGFYIASVKDMSVAMNEAYLSSINLHNVDHYINSGVLVMNLDLMRRDNVQEKLVAMAKHGIDGQRAFGYADQDALNIVCRDRIKFLDLKFNTFPGIIESALNSEDDRIKIQEFHGEKQLNDACNDLVILHFAGGKPWKFPETMFDDRWWEICRQSPFYEEVFGKYITSRVLADVDAIIERKSFRYSKCNYYRCVILSKLTCGKKKAHYQRRCKEIKKVLGIH
ncbi:MAG: glycosyltransferase family 8 protein [Puniceicoccales bacterium]|jgi:lipopolysaccharide biosynthesis glycosyltransferase|nr:glycosyltransferase family 8 protein [Puniceicoccales bacterium]